MRFLGLMVMSQEPRNQTSKMYAAQQPSNFAAWMSRGVSYTFKHGYHRWEVQP